MIVVLIQKILDSVNIQLNILGFGSGGGIDPTEIFNMFFGGGGGFGQGGFGGGGFGGQSDDHQRGFGGINFGGNFSR